MHSQSQAPFDPENPSARQDEHHGLLSANDSRLMTHSSRFSAQRPKVKQPLYTANDLMSSDGSVGLVNSDDD